MYPQYCRDTFTSYVTADRNPDFSLDPDAAAAAVRAHRPVVTLLTSPNNPTGTVLPLATAEAVLTAAGEHGGLVVVDEAYAEFRRPGTPSALGLLAQHRNLAVTRTMSKAFAYAGARVGYLVADPAIIDALRIVRLPYHLSAVTQVVASAAIARADELLAQVATLRAERDAAVEWLRAAGFSVADSDANFVLFGRFDDRHAVWQALLDRGVLIRETGPPSWLRVSIGTGPEMTAFREALQEVMAGTAGAGPKVANPKVPPPTVIQGKVEA
jgi:histidinol-phosphate aminotransferase